MKYHIEDFTETEYENILKTALERWTFVSFSDYKCPGNAILLRHDVDFSVHRALKLAQIENKLGIKSTFLLLPHCHYYNLFESEIKELIEHIAALGHYFGLHFDPSFYSYIKNEKEFELKLAMEKEFIEEEIGIELISFSLHNPGNSAWTSRLGEREKVSSMLNAYSSFLDTHYRYVSDSNGYWRFNRLKDVVESKIDEKLYVLIHPAWWTPKAMSPRDRISRCIDGRREKIHKYYDMTFEGTGRLNIKGNVDNE